MDEPSKRPRVDGQAPQPPAVGPPPALQPPAALQQQQQQQQQPAVALPAAAAPAASTAPPPPTPPEQLTKVLTVIQALVSARDAGMLAGVVGSLQPAVLADVVLAYLPNLPQRLQLPPDSAPLEPWVEQLLQLVAQQAPLQLPAAGGAPTAAAAAPQQQQRPPSAEQQQSAAQQPKAEAKAEPKAAPRPLPLALATAFKLEPVPLSDAQQRSLALAAVLRILRTDKTSRAALRTSLVAKLAADAEPAAAASTLMQQLLSGIAAAESGGADSSGAEGGVGSQLEVALQWLDVLFARESQPAPAGGTASDEEGGVAAGGSTAGGAAAAAADRRRQQRQWQGARGPPPGGSLYERMLLQLLRGLQEALPSSCRVINK